MRYGNLLLAGDAAHTVPPTGAKGLNLALADVKVLAEELERAIAKRDASSLDDYSTRALGRVWRAQHFSYWMTTMLHSLPDATPFDVRRQVGELTTLVDSTRGLDLPRRGIHGLAALLGRSADRLDWSRRRCGPPSSRHDPCGRLCPTRPQEPACPPV